MHLVLKTLLKLFAPIAPFITDYTWRELYGKESIHLELLPKPEWEFGLEKFTGQITEFNTNIWKMKKDKGLSLKTEVKIEVPKELKVFEKDLVMMHNIKA